MPDDPYATPKAKNTSPKKHRNPALQRILRLRIWLVLALLGHTTLFILIILISDNTMTIFNVVRMSYYLTAIFSFVIVIRIAKVTSGILLTTFFAIASLFPFFGIISTLCILSRCNYELKKGGLITGFLGRKVKD
ncbi:hypothetical protein OAB00_02820 [Akkermansiaceae bacterium]|nr:hypothetical protein [Akkermansiaceae bacterium]